VADLLGAGPFVDILNQLIEQHDDTPSIYRDMYVSRQEGHHMFVFLFSNARLLSVDDSFGGLRVTDHGIHEPDGATVIVDAVPEPAASSDFVLPLLHPLARHLAGTEIATEGMLTFGTGAGIFGQLFPRHPRIR
jgi:hypothetical protein